jgi:hypothetical protein
VVSRAHRGDRSAYLVALDSALRLRWASSLRNLLSDGCGYWVPEDGEGGNCRVGAPRGIDPETGLAPAGRASDLSTASPVPLPDGKVLYGAYAAYDGARGHTFLFGAEGSFVNSYDFGWDTTPAFFEHDGSYSILVKDNHYETDGPYFITQLNANLGVEWKFSSTNTIACARATDGGVSCTDDHLPGGFAWSASALAVDGAGVVYANSEDGNLYAISPGGVEKQRLFLDSTPGSAYTPVAIDAKGRIYTQNAGIVFIAGGP